jgi:hypothetical protein
VVSKRKQLSLSNQNSPNFTFTEEKVLLGFHLESQPKISLHFPKNEKLKNNLTFHRGGHSNLPLNPKVLNSNQRMFLY